MTTMHARMPSPTEKSGGRAETPSPPGCPWPCLGPMSQENGRRVSAEQLKPKHRRGLAGQKAEPGRSLGLQAHSRTPSLGPDASHPADRTKPARCASLDAPPGNQGRAGLLQCLPEAGGDAPHTGAWRRSPRPPHLEVASLTLDRCYLLQLGWPLDPGPDSGSRLGPAGEGPGWGMGRRTGFGAVLLLESPFPHPLRGLRGGSWVCGTGPNLVGDGAGVLAGAGPGCGCLESPAWLGRWGGMGRLMDWGDLCWGRREVHSPCL